MQPSCCLRLLIPRLLFQAGRTLRLRLCGGSGHLDNRDAMRCHRHGPVVPGVVTGAKSLRRVRETRLARVERSPRSTSICWLSCSVWLAGLLFFRVSVRNDDRPVRDGRGEGLRRRLDHDLGSLSASYSIPEAGGILSPTFTVLHECRLAKGVTFDGRQLEIPVNDKQNSRSNDN